MGLVKRLKKIKNKIIYDNHKVRIYDEYLTNNYL